MKAAPFEYHMPCSLDEARALLAEHGDDARLLAGGQSLVPMLAMRLATFVHLVDLAGVGELDGITDAGQHVVIGAMTRQARIASDGMIRREVPLLARSTALVGHLAIRTRGTLGGSLAHADPAAEYPAVATALDAELRVAGAAGSRWVAAEDFFVGTWTTTMEPDEILVAVRWPKARAASSFAVEEVARRRGDFAVAGVACALEADHDRHIQRAAITLFGVGARPYRARGAEQALAGAPVEADHSEVAELALDEAEFLSDIHASSAYRRRVVAVLVQRALARAGTEATSGL